MTSLTNTLDCTVISHTVERLSDTVNKVRGVIQTPFECEYPVYYSAILTRTGDHSIRVDGIAGFDSEYEKSSWSWNIDTVDNAVYINDRLRFTTVDCITFDDYEQNVFYKKIILYIHQDIKILHFHIINIHVHVMDPFYHS